MLENKNGFMLIEMLLVVSIVAVIALAIYSSLSAGVHIWKRLDRGAGEMHLFLALEKMQKNLRNSFAFKAIGFEGAENEISFPGLVLVKTDKEGEVFHQEPGRIRYYYSAASQSLCLEKTSYIDWIKGIKKECQKEIQGVKKIAFEYQDSHSWKTSWKQNKVPQAVRLKTVMADDNERQFTIVFP
ncbi:MAG: hypothetical protein A3H42_02905 [Deltaproteobacteria bacterium RIFCSPLOWO2_02_FULL_46_8]|nr:MAG: hypothetical protein A3H42_02905 [Deltaproteobacteria bacterium RIFCSPLOWO2_02_FULL_46_8]